MKLRRRQGIFMVISLVLLMSILIASFRDMADMSANPIALRDRGVDVPILNYHKIDYLDHPLSLPPAEFEKQIQYLQENGYRSISPDQLIAYLTYGRPLPEKPVMITFDDGYLDNYVNAYPILKKYDFTATIFVVTDLIAQDPRFMNWDQIREMHKNRFVFGSHSVTHTPLNQLSPEKLQRELVDSRNEIEKQLGQRPLYFAYPTGDYSAKIEEQVKMAGYQAAFSIRYGLAGINSSSYALERIPIFRTHQAFLNFFNRLQVVPVPERLNAIRNGKFTTQQ